MFIAILKSYCERPDTEVTIQAVNRSEALKKLYGRYNIDYDILNASTDKGVRI